MPTVDQAIDEFLSLEAHRRRRRLARSPAEHMPATASTTRFKERGYEVFPVNPNADEVMGDTCYQSLKDIPDGVDGVVIATNPKASLSVAQECKELGIDKVWFHKNIGAGSYSPGSARLLPRERHHRAGELPALVRQDRRTGSTSSSAQPAGSSARCPAQIE